MSNPTPKTTGPRPPKTLTEVDVPPPAVVGYIPYVLVVAAIATLLYTITKVPEHALKAAGVLLGLGTLGLGYVGWQDTHTLPQGDGFRKAVAATTAALVLALLATLGVTLFPIRPIATISLDRAGAAATIEVPAPGANLFLETSGTFQHDVGPSAQAKYDLHVARQGTEEELSGMFEKSGNADNENDNDNHAVSRVPVKPETASARHWLRTLNGPGRYVVTLDHMPDNLQPPLRVALRTEPFARWTLYALFGVLAVLVLIVDARIASRNVEPSYGPAMLFALVFVLYFRHAYAGTNISEALFASFLVGLLVGGLGGEVFARISRKIAV
jgi:hypothetical protein